MKQPWTPEFFKGNGRDGRLAAIEVYPSKRGTPSRQSGRPPQLPPAKSSSAGHPASGQGVGTGSRVKVVPGDYRSATSDASAAAMGADWGRIARNGAMGLAACGVIATLGFAAFSDSDGGSTTANSPAQTVQPTPVKPRPYQALTAVGQALADGWPKAVADESPQATSNEWRAQNSQAPQTSGSTIKTYAPTTSVSIRPSARDLSPQFGSGNTVDDSSNRAATLPREPELRAIRKPTGRRLSCPNVPLLPDP